MISRNSFFKLIRQDLQNRIWCPVLISVAYFLFLEVPLFMGLDALARYPRSYPYDAAVYIRDHFFGVRADRMAVLVSLTAFLCGVSGYAYLHSKKQIDVYHSLPVSRSKLFWSKYLSGTVQFIVPFAIHMMICAAIAAGRDLFTMDLFLSMASYTGLQLIVFMMAYGVSAAACGLAGNTMVSIMGTLVLFSYSTVIDILTDLLFSRFFSTYAVFGNRIRFLPVSEKIWCFSPSSMLLKLFSDPDSRMAQETLFRYDASYVGTLAAAALLYTLAAYIIHLRRASESAGGAIAFRAAEPLLKTLLVIPASFFSGAFFSELSSGANEEKWFLFGVVFGFAMLCILTEIVFRMDIRGLFMHKEQFFFNAACTALLFVVLHSDVLGYDTYVPADAQLNSCAVSISQLMPQSQVLKLKNGKRVYVSADEYRMDKMEIQGNPSVMELARKAADESLAYQRPEQSKDPEAYREVQEREETYRRICFGYKLLNGKTIYRQYIIDIADPETFQLLTDIFDDLDYKLGATPLFNDAWNLEFDIMRCSSRFGTQDIRLTPKMQSELIGTYQSEYTRLGLGTVMETVPVGTIEFLIQNAHDSHWYDSYSDGLCIYPQFTETIALLEGYGIDMEEELTAEEVESIRVTRLDNDQDELVYASYDPYDAFSVPIEETEGMMEFSDKEEIGQLLDNIVCDDLYWPVTWFADLSEPQYQIDIKPTGHDGLPCSYRFIKGRIPDFIKNAQKNG